MDCFASLLWDSTDLRGAKSNGQFSSLILTFLQHWTQSIIPAFPKNLLSLLLGHRCHLVSPYLVTLISVLTLAVG